MKGQGQFTRTSESGAGEEGTSILESGSQGEQYLPGSALFFGWSESLKRAGLGLGELAGLQPRSWAAWDGGVVRGQRRPAPWMRLPSSGEF